MKSTLDEAWAALAKSKEDMARYYNQHRTPAPNFTVGEKVFLDALDISTTHSTLHSPTCPIGLRSDCSESEWIQVESEWSPIGLSSLY
jgi:hypothetical protein